MFRLLVTLGLVAATVASLLLPAASTPASDPSAAVLARGRTLVAFGACNDCHTTGWRESDGKLPYADG
jgi:mono/diheme cytochrome c family protein